MGIDQLLFVLALDVQEKSAVVRLRTQKAGTEPIAQRAIRRARAVRDGEGGDGAEQTLAALDQKTTLHP